MNKLILTVALVFVTITATAQKVIDYDVMMTFEKGKQTSEKKVNATLFMANQTVIAEIDGKRQIFDLKAGFKKETIKGKKWLSKKLKEEKGFFKITTDGQVACFVFRKAMIFLIKTKKQ